MLLTKDRGEIIKRVIENGTLFYVVNTASYVVCVVFPFELVISLMSVVDFACHFLLIQRNPDRPIREA
jgi:hypothetical protein